MSDHSKIEWTDATWNPLRRFSLAPGVPTNGGGFNMNAGTLSTAGNLVFSGDGKGMLYALNATTGAKLWSFQVPPNIATPVTYELDGVQYMSVLSGNGSPNAAPTRLYTFAINAKAATPVKR